jgi:Fe2+ or Zn2+ uptake regulation protein
VSCEPNIQQALRSAGRRVTVQRSKILTALRHEGGHCTAEEIHERVLATDPQAGISLSTVYRTLETLRDLRLIASMDAGPGPTTFEWAHEEEPHHHLVCRVCEQVVEVSLASVAALEREIRERTGFAPDVRHLGIEGVCRVCAGSSRVAP